MLEHGTSNLVSPKRVVILGGSGFVGSELNKKLTGDDISVVSLSSADIDLCTEEGAAKLSNLLSEDDHLVILSALTPDKGRGIGTFMRNLKMIEGVCAAIETVKPKQVVYFSSDAVYPLTANPVTEASPAEPVDLYAAMHISRELMLKDSVGDRLCILRPTLMFGAADTHNSYGPNRFRRQAAADGKIGIGGEGEETRDHIFVEDVAALASLVLQHSSTGVMNVATGVSTDFGTVARLVAAQFDGAVEVCPSTRGMPVTYRNFDITACRKAFPDFVFTKLEDGIVQAHKEMK